MNIWIPIITGVAVIAMAGYINYLHGNIEDLEHTIGVYKDIHDTDQDTIDKLKNELHLVTILSEKQTKEITAVADKVSKAKQTIKKVDDENYLDKPIPGAILKQLHQSLRKN